MADKTADEYTHVGAALADKYRAFLEGLTGEELALYGASVGASEDNDTEGFAVFGVVQTPITRNASDQMTSVLQDVTVNKAKTADKAYQQMDAYIRS